MKRKIEEIKDYNIQIRHSNYKCKGCGKETQWSKHKVEWRHDETGDFVTICIECMIKKIAGMDLLKRND